MADPQRDAPTGEIVRALFPAEGVSVIPKVAKAPLAQESGNGGVLAWQNPEGVAILAAVVLDITTPQPGQTLDVGAAASASASSDSLLDGASLSRAGALSSFANAGTNGAAFHRLDARGGASDYVTATSSGAPSDLAGSAYIIYLPVS